MPTVLNPLSWVPFHGDKRSARAALLGGALVVSLGFHVGLPFVDWHSVEAVTDGPITVEFMPPPPMPLPEAEELVPVPNEEEVKLPEKEDLPAAAKVAENDPEPIEEPEEPEEIEEPEPPPPSPIAPHLEPTPAELAKIAEFDKRRAERTLLREKRRAEREARRAARLAALEAAGGKKGGAPPAGDYKTGKPDAVYMCNAHDRGMELKVSKARGINDWITIIPTVLAGFETRPSLGSYVDDIAQVITRNRDVLPKKLGFVELSLPNEVLQIQLEEPRGVRLAVGRLDARCLIGFKYASKLFPFSIARAPVRIIDNQNNTVTALVDVTFFKDASLEITSADGTPLPFKRARLKNGNDIKRNIQDHYEAARLAKGIADVFGIQIGPKRKVPPPKKAPSKSTRRTIASEKPRKSAD